MIALLCANAATLWLHAVHTSYSMELIFQVVFSFTNLIGDFVCVCVRVLSRTIISSTTKVSQ